LCETKNCPRSPALPMPPPPAEILTTWPREASSLARESSCHRWVQGCRPGIRPLPENQRRGAVPHAAEASRAATRASTTLWCLARHHARMRPHGEGGVPAAAGNAQALAGRAAGRWRGRGEKGEGGWAVRDPRSPLRWRSRGEGGGRSTCRKYLLTECVVLAHGLTRALYLNLQNIQISKF
jgi:hypothetical protein